MHLVENGQTPAADDINPDALEYLFGQTKSTRTPWVEMVGESEPVARITPAYIRLQTKVEVFKGALELTQEQLQEAHHKIGMLSAELARRDVLLKELADYRVRAAMAIGFERQNKLMQAALEELVTELENVKGEAKTAETSNWVVLESVPVHAETYRVKNERTFGFPYGILNALLVLGFAICVLATILH